MFCLGFVVLWFYISWFLTLRQVVIAIVSVYHCQSLIANNFSNYSPEENENALIQQLSRHKGPVSFRLFPFSVFMVVFYIMPPLSPLRFVVLSLVACHQTILLLVLKKGKFVYGIFLNHQNLHIFLLSR